MGCQKMLDNIQEVLAFKEVSIPFFGGGGGKGGGLVMWLRT